MRDSLARKQMRQLTPTQSPTRPCAPVDPASYGLKNGEPPDQVQTLALIFCNYQYMNHRKIVDK